MKFERTSSEEQSQDRSTSPSRWKPEVWSFSSAGRSYLVKDVSRTAALYRFSLGRWGLRHEAKVYRKLTGLARIPEFFGHLDGNALLFEKIEGKPLHRGDVDRLAPTFFQELAAWVGALHERGVVHLDLRQKRNILVDGAGHPWIVDFGGSLCLGTNWFSRRFLLPLFRWIDYSAITKFRVRYFPEQVTEEERKAEKRYRRIRNLWVFNRHPPRD